MKTPPDDTKASENKDRRERLARSHNIKRRTDNASYSSFIRKMRLLLPLIAIAIIVILLSWPRGQDAILPQEEKPTEKHVKAANKNELLNPRFESMDEKQQPYTVTAKTATQSTENENILILDEPIGDMLLNSQNWVALEATKGFYDQEEQKLDLKGAVKLFHDAGYQMESDAIFIDMKAGIVKTNAEVRGQGPEGTLQSQGLKAYQKDDKMIFIGPAKLALRDMSFFNGLSGSGPSDPNSEGATTP